ncbi:hypothetical protein Scep_014318 [Stephania cephalantha]|uniref:Uncharacterized protein n=1 Tax=Stephania cephalantha TaxID=152367 RepID=A0AAP0J0Q5_9MAGN
MDSVQADVDVVERIAPSQKALFVLATSTWTPRGRWGGEGQRRLKEQLWFGVLARGGGDGERIWPERLTKQWRRRKRLTERRRCEQGAEAGVSTSSGSREIHHCHRQLKEVGARSGGRGAWIDQQGCAELQREERVRAALAGAQDVATSRSLNYDDDQRRGTERPRTTLSKTRGDGGEDAWSKELA